MRIESSVTSLSWIPSEAIGGMTKMPFETGVAHYDPPPPDVIEDIDALQRDGRFRFASRLTAWIDVDDGAIVGHGQSGGGLICSTLLQLGKKQVAFEAIALPDLHPEPEVSDSQVTFFQTAGGRTGVPAPRRVRRAPYVQFAAPLAWTSLAMRQSRCSSWATRSSFDAVAGSGPDRSKKTRDVDSARHVTMQRTLLLREASPSIWTGNATVREPPSFSALICSQSRLCS